MTKRKPPEPEEAPPPTAEEMLGAVQKLAEEMEKANAELPNAGLGTVALKRAEAKGGVLWALRKELKWYGEGLRAEVSPPNVMARGNGRWSYNHGQALHIIQVQDDAPEQERMPTGTADEKERGIALCTAVLRHEAWHARLTDRSSDTLKLGIDHFGISPKMFNLFEDARIEQAARDEEGNDFGWLGCYRHPGETVEVENALAMFHWMTVCEGREKDIATAKSRWFGAETVKWRGHEWVSVDLIEEFVKAAQQASSTRHLWRLEREWLEAFGGHYVPPPEWPFPVPSDAVPGDGEGTQQGAGEESAESKAEAEAREKSGKGGEGKEKGTPGVGFGGTDIKPHAATQAEKTAYDGKGFEKVKLTEQVSSDLGLQPFVFSGSLGAVREIPLEQVQQESEVAARLRRMVRAIDASRASTATMGSKLHLANIISSSPDAFARYSGRKGKRKVCLVMDMSGSMQQCFDEHGRVFLSAMLRLHREGMLEVSAYLSGAGKCYKLPGETNSVTIQALTAQLGCETIDRTLEKARMDVMAADTVLVYTDGHLTDGDVNAGEWRSRGVDLIGVCTNDNSDYRGNLRTTMEQHFHKAIVENSPAELAGKILQYVLAHP